ncbi:putative nuclease HARBI1 [Argiope bruennichi]|uniref:putative nuclease HARBI1 n=1 Tax=Argiope bruennichi TaxID=94029 RepID=UPI00249531E9|nr:putative nuclease HARBI1 [Argiope bruennichi]
MIAEMRSRFIYLPKNESERREISQRFYDISGFPCVYGAIYCTHIPVVSPGDNQAELFCNRKGFFSINVQTVSNGDLYIRNIVARWPGSTHDSTIFYHSLLRTKFESGIIPPKYHLIIDNGYGCRTYSLTPFLNPATCSERR